MNPHKSDRDTSGYQTSHATSGLISDQARSLRRAVLYYIPAIFIIPIIISSGSLLMAAATLIMAWPLTISYIFIPSLLLKPSVRRGFLSVATIIEIVFVIFAWLGRKCGGEECLGSGLLVAHAILLPLLVVWAFISLKLAGASNLKRTLRFLLIAGVSLVAVGVIFFQMYLSYKSENPSRSDYVSSGKSNTSIVHNTNTASGGSSSNTNTIDNPFAACYDSPSSSWSSCLNQQLLWHPRGEVFNSVNIEEKLQTCLEAPAAGNQDKRFYGYCVMGYAAWNAGYGRPEACDTLRGYFTGEDLQWAEKNCYKTLCQAPKDQNASCLSYYSKYPTNSQ